VNSIQITDERFKTEDGKTAKCELDTHADTSVAGCNFRMCEFDGVTCEVVPFSEDYESTKDVPIVSAATAWTNEQTGETVILYFHQMLWYGGKLTNSLINPNQIRHIGRPVCDDVTDKARDFGINIDDEFVIPFEMTGTTIYFESRVPSNWELDNCRIIVMTDESTWDPNTVSIATVTSEPILRPTRESQREPMRVANAVDELRCISDVYDEKTMIQSMVSCVNIATLRRTISNTDDDDDEPSTRQVSFIGARNRHSHVTPEEVARKFKCGLDTAKQTLKTTTQHGVRHAIHPLHRRYRVDHLDLNRRRLHDTFYTDTMFSKVKSLNGNVCAQVFTNGRYTRVFPMPSKSSENIARALREFIDDVGVPETLICDLATEQVGQHTPMMREIRRFHIKVHNAEKGRSNQNHRAETEIRELKSKWKHRMRDKHIPSRLWDYGLVYIAELMSITARGPYGRPGIEAVMGHTIDISEWLDFEFYDYVWYWDEAKADMSEGQRLLGRWLGIAHRIGSDMTYWIMTQSGRVIARSTVQHVTTSDLSNTAVREAIENFDNAVNQRLAEENHVNIDLGVFYIEDEDVDDAPEVNIPTDDEYGDMIIEPRPDVDVETYDQYLNAEFVVNRDGEPVRARVSKRARTEAGSLVGNTHTNPLFDTREYECVFDDGNVERYTANIIAENLYSQCDSEGRSFLVLQEIVDHAKDNSALSITDGFTESFNGNRVPKKTTRGWKLLCQWRDGSSSWVPLVDLKDSNPVELAEYAVANRIQEEPAFKWWVADVLRRRNRIIAKLKRRYWRVTHKFGVRLPKTVEEALAIDAETGTTFWFDAITKEMSKVKIAFEFCEDWTPDQVRQGLARRDFVGFQEIECHMVFDVKMDLTRKARFVAGGHMTETPASLTYSSVVSRDSVRIAFLIAALNDLDILSCDISNAYLNAPCREKIWFVAGPEFGSRQGQVVKVVRALYGLKSSGAAWRNYLQRSILEDLQFEPTIADPDVYRKRSRKPSGMEYWELLLVYVDDILIISHEPNTHLDKLQHFTMSAAGKPDRYLGANIRKVTIPGDDTGLEYWSISSHAYVKNAVENVKELLRPEGYALKTTAKTPFPSNYRPELETSNELNADLSSRYQQLIGVLRWMVELGRVDIYYEVSVLSQYLVAPRVGHLETVYHIFAYLQKHDKSSIIFDPTEPYHDPAYFIDQDWTEFYGDVEEELPPKMPEPLGRPVTISTFVDANHAGNVVTRRSHTGILIYLQNTPVIWQSRRQNTVETSTFGSEFVALRTARDTIVALRYKLRMFGIPIEGPAYVYCDNQGVVKNVSIPESVLSKKHNAINYHAVRESVAANILRVAKEDSTTNVADLLTKPLTEQRRVTLLRSILYNL
jgi:hypothetical protein